MKMAGQASDTISVATADRQHYQRRWTFPEPLLIRTNWISRDSLPTHRQQELFDKIRQSRLLYANRPGLRSQFKSQPDRELVSAEPVSWLRPGASE